MPGGRLRRERKAIVAFWNMINEHRRKQRRKISSSASTTAIAAQTVECIRQLVEQEKRGGAQNKTLGTALQPPRPQIHEQKKGAVYVATGASKWEVQRSFPGPMAIARHYHTEA